MGGLEDRLEETASGLKELVRGSDISVVDVLSLGRSCDPVDDADDGSDEPGPSYPPSSGRVSAAAPFCNDAEGGNGSGTSAIIIMILSSDASASAPRSCTAGRDGRP